MLSSVCTYQTFPLKEKWCDFLLDLYSYDTKTALSVLPSLQSVFQSAFYLAPAVWSINLSERKTSVLLEVLKLQKEKKEVELTGCSHEESEVRSFLQCLPYISELSVCHEMLDEKAVRFFGNLFCAAAEREQQTRKKTLKLLSSVCAYETFPLKNINLHDCKEQEYQCNSLLDLCSHVKDCEAKTGLSVLPSLQSVLSVPAVWSINLSERKTSILLEVLKLQPEKKEVKLTGCTHEESEVRSFLKCLPYISQLSVDPERSDLHEAVRFFVNLFCAAAEREQQTGKKILKLLSSVCRYKTFPINESYMIVKYQCDFLLDLYSHMKDYKTKTGLSVLPSLQSVLQSAPEEWSLNLSERKTSILLEVLKLQPEKKEVELTGYSHEESEVRSFLQCLPYISQLSVVPKRSDDQQGSFFGNLFCAAAEREQKIVELLSSVCRYEMFPFGHWYLIPYPCDFLLDLYSHMKDYETKRNLSVLPLLQSVLQSAPSTWSINLSERKIFIFLEVLKLQPEKKQVHVSSWPDEESEVRSFLQCLPYLSQLSVDPRKSEAVRFFGNLFCAAAEREQQTEKILELLSSLSRFKIFRGIRACGGNRERDKDPCDFLLNLYSHMKDYETKTGLSVLPSLQSVFQSAEAEVWSINLSERKASILLEVLKLQLEKKEMELTGCSHEKSELKSFLQCLPYISQLSVDPEWSDEAKIRFFVNLFCAAAEREQQTGEKILELLSSVCRYKGFTLKEKWLDFLMDTYTFETETGLSVLPSLQSVFPSVVWFINLSERKTSILLEVLKLQPEKKHVELTGCSHEESEVRSFLQCLPYISQLSVDPERSDEAVRFFGNLFCAAAEREQQTGEKILELLSSLCTYQTFPVHERDRVAEYQCDFLPDLYSHVKGCETGLSVLPSLQSVFQSTPAVWSINLSERKTSILLEVLKLQSEKKQLSLTAWSDEESELRSFLQCLPYISQLSVDAWTSDCDEKVRFFGNLFCAAAEREQQTGEKILELLSSVCTYQTFPFNHRDMHGDINYIVNFDHMKKYQCDFLLDLYSHVKDCETKTGLSVLPSLQSVFQSAPAVWSKKLSKRKTSVLRKVLKLQSGKKEVKQTGSS
ncbi:uncharacterized protein LOC134620295 [Pelmatolapia mariae]|uniref:uncharacterized protein LOC134620295 n=1 Tax=Pelmatolapia mariae TaxID=158779 RepID=UPI002FE63C73